MKKITSAALAIFLAASLLCLAACSQKPAEPQAPAAPAAPKAPAQPVEQPDKNAENPPQVKPQQPDNVQPQAPPAPAEPEKEQEAPAEPGPSDFDWVGPICRDIYQDEEASVSLAMARQQILDCGCNMGLIYLGPIHWEELPLAENPGYYESVYSGSGASVVYPFISHIPLESIVENDMGADLFCAVPLSDEASVSINTWDYSGADDQTGHVGDTTLYRSEYGDPVLFTCNGHDLIPDVELICVDEFGVSDILPCQEDGFPVLHEEDAVLDLTPYYSSNGYICNKYYLMGDWMAEDIQAGGKTYDVEIHLEEPGSGLASFTWHELDAEGYWTADPVYAEGTWTITPNHPMAQFDGGTVSFQLFSENGWPADETGSRDIWMLCAFTENIFTGYIELYQIEGSVISPALEYLPLVQPAG